MQQFEQFQNVSSLTKGGGKGNDKKEGGKEERGGIPVT